jgi:hypothetical protein
LKYLLSTQASDGTWHVRTRALPIQPYFESGYPYEHDQWISGAAAAYATMAISAAVYEVIGDWGWWRSVIGVQEWLLEFENLGFEDVRILRFGSRI